MVFYPWRFFMIYWLQWFFLFEGLEMSQRRRTPGDTPLLLVRALRQTYSLFFYFIFEEALGPKRSDLVLRDSVCCPATAEVCGWCLRDNTGAASFPVSAFKIDTWPENHILTNSNNRSYIHPTHLSYIPGSSLLTFIASTQPANLSSVCVMITICHHHQYRSSRVNTSISTSSWCC